MNLVQINEHLKELPLQAIQQYANGSNPGVPPYLALGELQRREKMKQQMANQQGAGQGQPPSVKEQIEQKAGLAALQQAQQQMPQGQPGGQPPMPQQPQMPPQQPQMQPAQAMASGGVAGLPLRPDFYQFANGGIIAFEKGGTPPEVITIPRGTSDEEIDRIRRENPDAILRPEADVAAQQPAQPAPQPRMPPQQNAQPGMPNRSPLMDQAVAAASQMPEKPTAEGVNAGIAGLLPPELQDAARQKRAEEAQARMAESQKAYEASKPSGLDNMIKVFGQAGQYKGLTGLGPAYTQNQEQLRARDAAFRKEQEGMRSGAEKQQLEEAAGIFGARSKDYSGQMEGYRKQLGSRVESLASLAGADQRAIDAALGRMNDTELTKLRIAAEKANALRPGEGERITAQILKLRAEGKTKEADALLEAYSQVKSVGVAGVGSERNAITQLKTALQAQKYLMENGDDAERKEASREYARLAKEISKAEQGGAQQSMSMDDVRATAKSSGKSEAEVIAAAQARGYTIK